MTGPFLTQGVGQVNAAVDRFVTDLVWTVAAQALADVHKILDAKIRNPTPFYETQLMIERMTADSAMFHDRGIVYGPWLEGIGSRNSTTHFKGYRAVRTTYQMLSRKIPALARPGQELLIRRLGG